VDDPAELPPVALAARRVSAWAAVQVAASAPEALRMRTSGERDMPVMAFLLPALIGSVKCLADWCGRLVTQ